MSLLLAIAIWFLIRDYLKDQGEYYDRSEDRPPKGILVDPQPPADGGAAPRNNK